MSSLIDSNGFLQMPQTQYVEDQNLNKLYNDLSNRAGMRFAMAPGPEHYEGTRQLENQIKEAGGNPYGYFSESGNDLSDQEKTQASKNFNMTNALMGGNSGGGGFGSPFGNLGGRLSGQQPRMQQGRQGGEAMGGLLNGLFGTGGAAQMQQQVGQGVREQLQMENPFAPQQADIFQTGYISDPDFGMPDDLGGFDQGPITAGKNPYASGNNGAGAYGSAAIGGLLSGNLGGALQAAGGYYAGQKGIEGAYQTGVAGLDMAEQMGQRGSDAAQFKPYGVTSNLANIQTDASGGTNIGLNQQQQRMQNQLMSGAQQQFGNVNSIDPSIAAQRGAMGGMFGQQLGQQGQPTGMEGITQAGLGGAMGQFGAAGQPQDLQNLRTQYGNLASQAGQGLLTSPEQAQNDIYSSIRATQRPEEQRNAMELEEKLLAQGRLGVSTGAYGGTPEQLAMAKAQAEAQNSASLQARQMGMQEQAQGLQRAQTLTGMTQNLAGMGSDLETAGIGRGATLAGVGMQGAQTGQGFDQQNLQNLMALQGADQGAAAAQQALQQGRLGMGTGMLGAGYMPQQQALALAQLGQAGGQMAQRGQLAGAELQSQMGGRGLESYMQGGNMANLLQQQQLQGMMGSMFGNQPTAMEQALMAMSGGKFQNEGGLVTQGIDAVKKYFGGDGDSPSYTNQIADYFAGGGNGGPSFNPFGGSTSTGGLGGGGSNSSGGFLTNDLFGGMSSGSDEANKAFLDAYGGG